jgi:hypothetical protein
MYARRVKAGIRWATIVLTFVLSINAKAQKKISCPDGDHYEMDLQALGIQYNASSFSATLNGLGLLGGRVQIDQKKLQEAAASTQQWNEYLKGLAAGYNVCAITKEQYHDGLSRIYPRLQQDATALESIRKLIMEGRKADEKRLQVLIDSYLGNLRDFRQITSQEDDVRQRGLLLSRQITDFLVERNCGAGPAESMVVNAPPDNITPPCMLESRKIFVERFETSIVNLHDEFSSRGLRDSSLDAIYTHLPGMAGNVDSLIQEIAATIRKLAVLVPPRDLYAGVSDQQLAATALDQVRSMEERTNEAMTELRASSIPNGVRSLFSFDFKECCLSQVEYLRAELLKRLGPSAYSSEEMQSFNGTMGLTEIDTNPTASIGAVANYIPHFRRLAILLKHKATPLRPPLTLHFSELVVPYGGKGFQYQEVITIDVPNDTQSGYIVVLFDGRPATVGGDLADATFIATDRDVIDDKQLTDIVAAWDPAKSHYALKIGRTPVFKDKPIHIFTEAPQPVTASQVLYFEE